MINQEVIENSIVKILGAIGENVTREGLRETPRRVSKMYTEIFKGIDEDPSDYLKLFQCDSSENEIITVCDIPFYSMCEHHMLPFFGKISIAYIPNNYKILGISKFSRIIECFSKRLQIQENLTSQIADFLYDNLKPKGILVFVEAEHLCMTMRGIKAFGSKTKTICSKGIFNDNYEKKSEALFLIKENN